MKHSPFAAAALALALGFAATAITGCGGGSSGSAAPAMTASGGGTSTVVPGSTFQSFITLTSDGDSPEFTLSSVTPPQNGPTLTNVQVNTVDYPGLVTADVPARRS